jgi:hypothetical protein
MFPTRPVLILRARVLCSAPPSYRPYADNLLLHPDAEPELPKTDPSCDPRDPCSGAAAETAAMAAMASAYKHSIRIRPIDIIRVPKYERVWQIGSMGQVYPYILHNTALYRAYTANI